VGLLFLTRKKSLATPNNIPPDFNSAVDLIFTQKGYGSGMAANWKAIAKMETAGFTSSLYRNANNPWGMQVAKVRPNSQAGKYVGSAGGGATSFNFARYDSLGFAVADIILWMEYTGFPKGDLSLEKHVAEMDARGYFGDESYDSYLSKVRAWLKR